MKKCTEATYQIIVKNVVISFPIVQQPTLCFDTIITLLQIGVQVSIVLIPLSSFLYLMIVIKFMFNIKLLCDLHSYSNDSLCLQVIQGCRKQIRGGAAMGVAMGGQRSK